MAADKHASVHWEGAGKTGKGLISTETGALKDAPYGFASRFEDDRRGTNPEEILGAAHAGCLTMAFAFALEGAGLTATSIDTKAAGQGRFGLQDRSHPARARSRGARARRGQVPGACGRRQGRLPAVEGAGQRARDHLEGDAQVLMRQCPPGRCL
jgi:OsmC subfamily peroxiredoxin